MRDYEYETTDGRNIKVADLSTAKIHDLIRDGVQVTEAGLTEESIMDRLHLELFIRERGLR